MATISSYMLADTYNLVQLARETALARGNADQAKRLSPVVDQLRDLVVKSRENVTPAAAPADYRTAALHALQSAADAPQAAENFRNTLNKSTAGVPSLKANMVQNINERSQLVRSMSSASMGEVEIARQMGMSREEVRMILRLSPPPQNEQEVIE